MKKTALLITSISAGLLLSTSASALDVMDYLTKKQANQYEYNYVDVSSVSMDGGLSGLGVDVSYDLKPNMSFILNQMAGTSGVVKYTRLTLGVAHHAKFTEVKGSDLVLHASYLQETSTQAEITTTCYTPTYCVPSGLGLKDVAESGLKLGGTLRYAVSPEIEVFGDASFYSAGVNGLVVTPGARYEVNKQVSAFVKLELVGETKATGIGIRYHY